MSPLKAKNLPHKSLSMYNKGHHLLVRFGVCIICDPLGLLMYYKCNEMSSFK